MLIQGRLVSAMMKKYLAEGMVPVLAELKRALEAARHPLLGQLLATFRSLLREHKGEVGQTSLSFCLPACLPADLHSSRPLLLLSCTYHAQRCPTLVLLRPEHMGVSKACSPLQPRS
jgi:hypothetical protein